MNCEDFAFTIGFQGDTAIVDGQSKKKYAKLSVEELLNLKLFKPAFRRSIFSGNEEEMERIAEAYRRETGESGISVETLKRLFGVFGQPHEDLKVKVL